MGNSKSDRKAFLSPTSNDALYRRARKQDYELDTFEASPAETGTDSGDTGGGSTLPPGSVITPPVIDGPAGFPIAYSSFPVGVRPNDVDWYVADLQSLGLFENTFLSSNASGVLAVNLGNLAQAIVFPGGSMVSGPYEVVNGVLYAFGNHQSTNVLYWTGSAWAVATSGAVTFRAPYRYNGQWWAVGSNRRLYSLQTDGTWVAQTVAFSASTASGRWLGINGGRIWLLANISSSTVWYTMPVGGTSWTQVASISDATNRVLTNQLWVPLAVLPSGNMLALMANRTTTTGNIDFSLRAEIAPNSTMALTAGAWRVSGNTPEQFSAIFSPSGRSLLEFVPSSSSSQYAIDVIDVTGYAEVIPGTNYRQATLRWRPGLEGTSIEWSGMVGTTTYANRASVSL